MGRKKRYTAADVIDALRETHGMVYLAADRLGCSHTTVYNYMKKHPSVKTEFDRMRGKLLDNAEQKLRGAILAGEHWAVAFALKTIGKHRGYVEKQAIEHTVPDGIAVTHHFQNALKRAYNDDNGTGQVSDDGSEGELPV